MKNNQTANIIIIFFVICIIIYFFYVEFGGKSGQIFDLMSEITESFEGKNALYTAYPNNFICSKDMDKSPLHIRVTDAGGIMYVSNRVPISNKSNKSCKIIPCPGKAKILNSMYTVPEISHYKPLPVHDRTVCWNCS